MKVLAALSWLVLITPYAFTQTATVTRNVNLRPEPSTSQPSMMLLTPATNLQLIAISPTNGFYHVRVNATEGWVWARNISIRKQTHLQALVPPSLAATHHCTSVGGLPDPSCTPGVVRTTDRNNICHTSTKAYRPPVSYTNALKKQQIGEYGWTDKNMADYEEDHLISLELGGDGKDPRNLWPEPHTGQFNSFEKDKVENWLHKQICSNQMSVADAQKGIATNWKQYVAAAGAP